MPCGRLFRVKRRSLYFLENSPRCFPKTGALFVGQDYSLILSCSQTIIVRSEEFGPETEQIMFPRVHLMATEPVSFW